MDALQAGLGSEQGQAAINDVPNFATGGVDDLLRRDRLTRWDGDRSRPAKLLSRDGSGPPGGSSPLSLSMQSSCAARAAVTPTGMGTHFAVIRVTAKTV